METKELLFRAKELIRIDYYLYFEKYCEKYEINTALRLAHFLAQVNHESSNMKVIEENLNYSAKRLLQVFPKYFKTFDEAKMYEYRPEKIANRVYANRMGNGDEQSGDGYKYRGRGLIQLTGKNNYLEFSKWYNDSKIFVDNPDLLLQPQFAVLSAFYYWTTRKINDMIIEKADQYKVCKRITKVINGGYNGLDDRWQRFKIIYNKINFEK
jgi:putative chitinase